MNKINPTYLYNFLAAVLFLVATFYAFQAGQQDAILKVIAAGITLIFGVNVVVEAKKEN